MTLRTEERWRLNRKHWNQNLDAHNLKSEGQQENLETLLALYETADVRIAMDAMEPLRHKTVLDLGGGLGLYAILLARRGATVVIADLSHPRLKQAKKTAEEAGVGDRVHGVLCLGEDLPFLTDSLDRETTKSVLIHTKLDRTARELARSLKSSGKCAFIEPLDSNPIVNAYRLMAGPKIWRDITDYFNPQRSRVLGLPFAESGMRVKSQKLYFIGFLATFFNYLVKSPALYRLAENLLLAVDRILFALLPLLRRYSWFMILHVEPRQIGKSR